MWIWELSSVNEIISFQFASRHFPDCLVFYNCFTSWVLCIFTDILQVLLGPTVSSKDSSKKPIHGDLTERIGKFFVISPWQYLTISHYPLEIESTVVSSIDSRPTECAIRLRLWPLTSSISDTVSVQSSLTFNRFVISINSSWEKSAMSRWPFTIESQHYDFFRIFYENPFHIVIEFSFRTTVNYWRAIEHFLLVYDSEWIIDYAVKINMLRKIDGIQWIWISVMYARLAHVWKWTEAIWKIQTKH